VDEIENENIIYLRKMVIDALKTNSTTNLKDECEINRIRETIQEIRKLGIIRNHSLIVSMMKKLVLTGESNFIRIKELEEKGPWKWDQLRKQLAVLEKNGYISIRRDKARNITCALRLNASKSSYANNCLLEYYSNYFKRDQFTLENISKILSLRKQLLMKQERLKKIKRNFEMKKISPISKKELANFVEELSKAYTFDDSEDFEEPITRMLKVLVKNPLFLKGLSTGER